MDLFLTLVVGTASALVTVIELCFLVRAVLSWLPIGDDNPILKFVFMVTEPIIMPIRALFERLGWFQNMPIDISFLVAYLLLIALSGALFAV